MLMGLIGGAIFPPIMVPWLMHERPARAVAFVHIGKQCELRDGENLTTDVLNRAVHFALLIFEYPQIEDLVSQPRNLLVTILIGHTHQKS